MKLHSSVVDRLITISETYGGHKNQQKLKSMLSSLDFSEYTRNSGEKIIVFTDDLKREIQENS